MADAFGTIPFTVLAASMGRIVRAEVAQQHIPGGTVTYYDYAGRRATEFRYLLLMSKPDYWALEAMAGGTAQLVSAADGTTTCAVLLELGRAQHVPGGTTFVTAHFAVVVA